MAHINNYNGNEFLCKEPDLAKVTTGDEQEANVASRCSFHPH